MRCDISVYLTCLYALLSTTASAPEPNHSQSIIESASSARIVNGNEVDISEVPYQGILRRKVSSGWAHMCGAVIISDRVLMTAAHCIVLYEKLPSNLRVVVGTSFRLSGGKSYEVEQVRPHKEYSATTFEHDIGLVVLPKSLSFGKNVQPINYAPSNLELPNGTEAIVSGYGSTEYEGTPSTSLRAAIVYIVEQASCQRAYLRLGSVTAGMVCANAFSPNRDACQGDSGGPLVAKGNLVGIVSWGEGCADSLYPGVYTRVSAYHEWINRNMHEIYP